MYLCIGFQTNCDLKQISIFLFCTLETAWFDMLMILKVNCDVCYVDVYDDDVYHYQHYHCHHHHHHQQQQQHENYLSVVTCMRTLNLMCVEDEFFNRASVHTLGIVKDVTVESCIIVVHRTSIIQGGSNMTGTNCDLFTHKSSRSYLNLVWRKCFVRKCVGFVWKYKHGSSILPFTGKTINSNAVAHARKFCFSIILL
jgi:hypothetical protein